jgi:hypothetical protein
MEGKADFNGDSFGVRDRAARSNRHATERIARIVRTEGVTARDDGTARTADAIVL